MRGLQARLIARLERGDTCGPFAAAIVDRRDESFSTASTLMTSVSDTRGNLIRNL